MEPTAILPAARRQRVESRLQTNVMSWLTTVSPAGRPDTVPVWFLVRDDDTILTYSEPGKPKLRNIEHNAHVALGSMSLTSVATSSASRARQPVNSTRRGLIRFPSTWRSTSSESPPSSALLSGSPSCSPKPS